MVQKIPNHLRPEKVAAPSNPNPSIFPTCKYVSCIVVFCIPKTSLCNKLVASGLVAHTHSKPPDSVSLPTYGDGARALGWDKWNLYFVCLEATTPSVSVKNKVRAYLQRASSLLKYTTVRDTLNAFCKPVQKHQNT